MFSWAKVRCTTVESQPTLNPQPKPLTFFFFQNAALCAKNTTRTQGRTQTLVPGHTQHCSNETLCWIWCMHCSHTPVPVTQIRAPQSSCPCNVWHSCKSNPTPAALLVWYNVNTLESVKSIVLLHFGSPSAVPVLLQNYCFFTGGGCTPNGETRRLFFLGMPLQMVMGGAESLGGLRQQAPADVACVSLLLLPWCVFSTQ